MTLGRLAMTVTTGDHRPLVTLAATTDLTMIVPSSAHITTLIGISGLDRAATVSRAGV